MKTISLCIIVKNESHVIERCLNSVKPLLDYVLVIDTGSTDNTIEVIENWLRENNLPGEVISEPWKNFAYNRSFALSELRKREFIDYALMIDADEILKFDEDFNPQEFKSNMDVDLFDITTNMGGISYVRPQLSSNRKNYRYEGVVHEFLTGEVETRRTAEGFHNQPIQDSNRNRSGNKFEGDVILLKEAIEETQDEWFKSRYTFYLAQSLRDLQRREESLEYYLKRTQMGFWVEEVFISYLNAGNLMKELGHPKSEVIHTYMKGHESVPNRVECIYSALNYCRINGLNQYGYILGKQAIRISKPVNALFTEDWMYDYGALDEFSIVTYYSGNFLESKEACEKLLSENKIPHHYYDRVRSNLQFSLDKLK
jgi:glycosyltransferase involved in cell wall biosynthesis